MGAEQSKGQAKAPTPKRVPARVLPSVAKPAGAQDRKQRARGVAKSGAFILDKLLLLGSGIPVLGNICQVSRTILESVVELAGTVDDVLEMGERVLDTLQLLNRMADNMTKFPATRELEDRWRTLYVVLADIEKVICSFGRRGWMRRAFAMHKHAKALSELDDLLCKDIGMLLNIYNMERDGQILAPRTYALEAIVAQLVQRHMQEQGVNEAAAKAALPRSENTLRAMAFELSIPEEELMSELRDLAAEMREGFGQVHAGQAEMSARLDKMESMLSDMREMGIDDGEKVYRYDPYDDEDVDQEASQLGEGTFGYTHRMRHRIDGQLYAVKMIKVKKARSFGMDLDKLRAEATRLAVLNHANIVRYYTCCEFKKGRVFAIVTELLEGGSFKEKLRGQPVEATIARWTEQIASALAHMHSMRMQHRDLKPDNVLFDRHDQPKIIDLGLACMLESKSRVLTIEGAVGTNLYMSPEKGSGRSYDDKDDVWALGCMLAGGVIGKLLEDTGLNTMGIFALHRPNIDRLVADATTASARLGTIVSMMLAQDPRRRLTAEQAVEALRVGGMALPDRLSDRSTMPDRHSPVSISERSMSPTEAEASALLQPRLPPPHDKVRDDRIEDGADLTPQAPPPHPCNPSAAALSPSVSLTRALHLCSHPWAPAPRASAGGPQLRRA